ncbi:hypothetical protein BN1723_006258 [Verticillium longisporum]|uniref:Uncharacterized protein n=1 Tax=Verticillium longisporum TaxID=100787 RepID=A0A0G4NE01_VERLO|nr:hypothetical protein BN1723_006258 [Verticillium longisporum]
MQWGDERESGRGGDDVENGIPDKVTLLAIFAGKIKLRRGDADIEVRECLADEGHGGDAVAVGLYIQGHVIAGQVLRQELGPNLLAFPASHVGIPAGSNADVGIVASREVQVLCRGAAKDRAVLRNVYVDVSPRSLVFPEAENRLWAAVAALEGFVVQKARRRKDYKRVTERMPYKENAIQANSQQANAIQDVSIYQIKIGSQLKDIA